MPAPMQPTAALRPPTSGPAALPAATPTSQPDLSDAGQAVEATEAGDAGEAGEAATGDVLDTAAQRAEDRNEVRLVGRVSGAPERRSLPSGDELVSMRLVVSRRPTGVDTLDISVGPAPPPGARRREGQVGRRLLATAERLEPGDRVEVRGSLRRRWWGTGGVRQSRVEVRAEQVTPPVDL
jgi:single-strand DNA-binding protein